MKKKKTTTPSPHTRLTAPSPHLSSCSTAINGGTSRQRSTAAVNWPRSSLSLGLLKFGRSVRLLKLGRSMLARLLFLSSVRVNCLTRVEVQGSFLQDLSYFFYSSFMFTDMKLWCGVLIAGGIWDSPFFSIWRCLSCVKKNKIIYKRLF